jgi:hypothetical protein
MKNSKTMVRQSHTNPTASACLSLDGGHKRTTIQMTIPIRD